MQRIRNSFIFALAFCFTTVAFAKLDCPPTEMVENLKFVRVDGVSDIWDLFPDTFDYAGKTWQVIFTAYLPDAKNKEEALTQGQDFYRYGIQFFNPPVTLANSERPVCYYAQQEASHFVRAIAS